MKKTITLLLAILAMSLIPARILASSGTRYNIGDIEVINTIIAENGLPWTPASLDGQNLPNDWVGVEWSNASSDKRIVTLRINDYGLTGKLDVTGLSSLIGLRCSNNMITAIDATGLVKIEWLNLSDNYLTEISVSEFNDLVDLGCGGNKLRELDISSNVALRGLDCFRNELTSLNVSNNTELEVLVCHANLLGSLDISNNNNLRILNVNQTGLSRLNLRNNPALEILMCYDNQLNRLDLSNNVSLEGVDCSANQLSSLIVRNLPNLMELYCSKNVLSALDISGTSKLEVLHIDINVLPGIAAITGLDESVTRLKFDPQDTLDSAPNLHTADEWARMEISSAVAKGIVPLEMQEKYKDIITRREFCWLAISYVEYAMGKPIDAVITELGLTVDADAFQDTKDELILAAFTLGITNGTTAPTDFSPGVFSPDSSFTREEAAVMIMRACRIADVGRDDSSDQGFADISVASAWAKDGINFCRANGIMGGTGNSNFSPKNLYTRQESIVTFNRIG